MNLTWFEKLPDMDAYRVNGQYAPYALNARDVRFTDAELAAEVLGSELACWVRRTRCDIYRGEDHLWDHYEKAVHEAWVLNRFAIHPHFDQNQPT
jgi:hypothetical protein